MRKLRLFWLMTISFATMIALGVCGVMGFIGLTFTGTLPSGPLNQNLKETAAASAILLGDFYQANGNSWSGVEQRFTISPFDGQNTPFEYMLFDPEGLLIASSNGDMMRSDRMRPNRRERLDLPHPSSQLERRSIVVKNREVGILVVNQNFRPSFISSTATSPRPSWLWNLWRNFMIAGAIISLFLLGLAITMAGRLSRPLRAITYAAERVANGRLDVQVPGAGVREMDDLAKAFNRMSTALATADQQRRQMTADIAHELRTPLSIIKGRLEGIQDGVYSATAEQIEQILHETDLLERLIDDLRILALAEAGQLPLFPETIAPMLLLNQAARAFASQAAERQISLSVQAADDLPDISVDPQRITQVLGNLVANALHHTPAGGTITLAAQLVASPTATKPEKQAAAPEAILLQVSDTGAGIAAADLPHVFDRFWRSDRARTRDVGGAGLGLAIVKQISESHGGSVSVASQIGQGTTFSIRLPLAPQPPRLPAQRL